jgi:glucosamine--fructose-6-phosphate aminotransferase (isomerizing)
MCGIFGVIASTHIDKSDLKKLASLSLFRGRDASGYFAYSSNGYMARRASTSIVKLLKSEWPTNASQLFMAHSRLITNDHTSNQPVIRGNVAVIHNGIIVNSDKLWEEIRQQKILKIDTEIINGLCIDYLERNQSFEGLPEYLLEVCSGSLSAAVAIPECGKLLLLSNNGSLYVGQKESSTYFASEASFLSSIGCEGVCQLNNDYKFFDLPVSHHIDNETISESKHNPIPSFKNLVTEEAMLQYPRHSLRRCTKCILPETMPFITFNTAGVCNYCTHYKSRNTPKPQDLLFSLVEPYRRIGSADCIVPFSGGRDSCWSLHLIVNELKMKPITYTYDWGMVTDLGRRNISRMCAQLGVENIIISANIPRKRMNIARNLQAWLKSPHLGMISILTAGDKHFFRYVESVKKSTGINLNLWGVNPLEVTHFKAGFLGIKPDFDETRVYMNGFAKQFQYQKLRFKAMAQSPGYFNPSLWDTLSGEYYRSFTQKSDYYHIFDYWRWDEDVCNSTLKAYDWELAPDTSTTWRIGDGTAAFYNYIYYLVAGFTEHDTFRSNQIREGQISRDDALHLVSLENSPRYQNIRWYLDVIGMDFVDVIGAVNLIPRKYESI